MKVLFTAMHFGYFRNFESVIRSLAEHGHRVHLVAQEPERFGGQPLVERLAAAYPAVSWGWMPPREGEQWAETGVKLRYGLEYVRAQDPAYDNRPKIRRFTSEHAPRVLLWFYRGPITRTAWGRRVAAAAVMRLEGLMPRSDAIARFLREQAPDVLLMGSMTYSRSQEFDYLRSARALGIPTAACIYSWDHLTNKAWLRTPPDRTLVWNDIQRQEAVGLHYIPADRVVVTGAQCYDQWFDRQPRLPRDEFSRAVGLPSDRPYLLYVCSVLLRPGPSETGFVLRWIEAIRSSKDPALKDIGILIRPHPERLDDWAGIDLARFGNVAFCGRNPIDASAKAEYFDSMYHSAAVVGLVTTAFIEAAIAGRPVYTIQPPEFRLHQDGAPHFHHLVTVEGGLLIVARDFDEHLDQIKEAVAGGNPHAAQSRRFLTAFVRPHGLERPATDYFVRAVENLAQATPEPARDESFGYRAFAPAVRRLAMAAADGFLEPLMRDADEVVVARTESVNRRRKEAYVREKQEHERQSLQSREARIRQKEDQRREKDRRRRRSRRSVAKVIADVKGRVKQIIGSEVR